MAMTAGARRRDWAAILLISPASALFLGLLVLPMVVVVVLSLGNRAEEGGWEAALTLAQYANLPARWKAFQNTLLMAPAGTLLCLLIAYPLAYYLAVKADPRRKLLLLILVILPFWTSFLVRTYAWIFILGGKGIPSLLETLGYPDVRLINTPFAVMCGIVYAYLPLMVFPIYVSLERLDKRLLEASADLYAGPFASFLQVTLPLSAPGVVTGCMLVFILLMGEYLIPALLGGGKVFFVGNALVDLFLQSRNWPFGAACAVSLVAIMLVTVTVYLRMTIRNPAMRDQALL
jgi:spermidine/putrescine transport system permease protein